MPERFAECGSCGAYHRADYWGDCRNDAERFDVPPEGAEVEYLDDEKTWPIREDDMLDISCCIGTEDARSFARIINQGIDARLEAFVDSQFRREGGRLYLDFDDSEIPILLRRLAEDGTDDADRWESDIVEAHYGVEVI